MNLPSAGTVLGNEQITGEFILKRTYDLFSGITPTLDDSYEITMTLTSDTPALRASDYTW